MKSYKLKLKDYLILLACCLGAFLLMEVQRLFLPMRVRFVTSPLYIFAALLVFFSVIRPENIYALVRSLMIPLLLFVALIIVIMHVIVRFDVLLMAVQLRILYLTAFVVGLPWLAGWIYSLFPRKGPRP